MTLSNYSFLTSKWTELREVAKATPLATSHFFFNNLEISMDFYPFILLKSHLLSTFQV